MGDLKLEECVRASKEFLISQKWPLGDPITPLQQHLLPILDSFYTSEVFAIDYVWHLVGREVIVNATLDINKLKELNDKEYITALKERLIVDKTNPLYKLLQ